MKLITVFLIMCLVYISPGMQAKDFPKGNAFVIVDITENLETELSLSPYQDCKLLSGLEYERDKEHRFIYKVPKEMLPCQLLLSCRVHTGENYYSNLFRELVYLNTDSVWLTIDSCSWEINWHGDPENTASQRFNTTRYRKEEEIYKILKRADELLQKGVDPEEQRETYRKACVDYNNWIDQEMQNHQHLWVSHFWKTEKKTFFDFYETPAIQFEYIVQNYFKYEDFSDTTLLNSAYYPRLLREYINYSFWITGKDEFIPDDIRGNLSEMLRRASRGNLEVYRSVLRFLPDLLNERGLSELQTVGESYTAKKGQ